MGVSSAWKAWDLEHGPTVARISGSCSGDWTMSLFGKVGENVTFGFRFCYIFELVQSDSEAYMFNEP